MHMYTTYLYISCISILPTLMYNLYLYYQYLYISYRSSRHFVLVYQSARPRCLPSRISFFFLPPHSSSSVASSPFLLPFKSVSFFFVLVSLLRPSSLSLAPLPSLERGGWVEGRSFGQFQTRYRRDRRDKGYRGYDTLSFFLSVIAIARQRLQASPKL